MAKLRKFETDYWKGRAHELVNGAVESLRAENPHYEEEVRLAAEQAAAEHFGVSETFAKMSELEKLQQEVENKLTQAKQEFNTKVSGGSKYSASYYAQRKWDEKVAQLKRSMMGEHPVGKRVAEVRASLHSMYDRIMSADGNEECYNMLSEASTALGVPPSIVEQVLEKK